MRTLDLEGLLNMSTCSSRISIPSSVPTREEPMEQQPSNPTLISHHVQHRHVQRGLVSLVSSCSSGSTTTGTTTSSSTTSSSTGHPRGIRQQPHHHQRIVFSGKIAEGGSSTASSSTEETEARERRFGSIDLHQPLLKGTTAAAAAAVGTQEGKPQGNIDPQLKQALLADFG